MIVVLDCNIWISLIINGQVDFIANLSDNGILIASCPALRDEILNVLKRPKIARFIPNVDVDKVMEFHDLVTTNYKTGKIVRVTNDIKDDYLFALSLKCKADYLVTGDKLLLDVIKYKHIHVISLFRFKELLK
jgi:putative PIN family toxin of toxin-antitoxin system